MCPLRALVHKIMGMLISLLWSMPPEGEGWSRYVTLILDGLSPQTATPLPPSVGDGNRRETSQGQSSLAGFAGNEGAASAAGA